jgi:hypothetical protein
MRIGLQELRFSALCWMPPWDRFRSSRNFCPISIRRDYTKDARPNKDTNMTESITDAFKCNQCGAVYDSEKELREHQQSVHHVAGYPPAGTDVNQPVKAKTKNA